MPKQSSNYLQIIFIHYIMLLPVGIPWAGLNNPKTTCFD